MATVAETHRIPRVTQEQLIKSEEASSERYFSDLKKMLDTYKNLKDSSPERLLDTFFLSITLRFLAKTIRENLEYFWQVYEHRMSGEDMWGAIRTFLQDTNGPCFNSIDGLEVSERIIEFFGSTRESSCTLDIRLELCMYAIQMEFNNRDEASRNTVERVNKMLYLLERFQTLEEALDEKNDGRTDQRLLQMRRHINTQVHMNLTDEHRALFERFWTF